MKKIGRCGHEVIVESFDFSIENDGFIVVVTWCPECEERDKIMYVKEKDEETNLYEKKKELHDLNVEILKMEGELRDLEIQVTKNEEELSDGVLKEGQRFKLKDIISEWASWRAGERE